MKHLAIGCLASCVFLCVSAQTSVASSAHHELGVILDEVRALIVDAKKPPVERQDALHILVLSRFDVREMSRRALAIHWKTTSLNQERFVLLFTRYIERLFLKHIRKIQDVEVTLLVDRTARTSAYIDTKFLVKTPKSQNDYYVDFKMRIDEDRWKIFDVIIQGVSIVSMFRSQFKTLLEKHSFEELLDILEKKISAV